MIIGKKDGGKRLINFFAGLPSDLESDSLPLDKILTKKINLEDLENLRGNI